MRWHTVRQADFKAGGQKIQQADRLADRQADKLADMEAGSRQVGRQKDR